MKLTRSHLLQVAGVAVVAFCVNAPSWGAEPNIVGSWKLLSYVSEELATGKKTAPFGEHPKGYLIYTPQGRMMGLLVHETRSPPKVDGDRINLHKYMVSYSGHYTVEGDKVVHHVDVSWNEALTGTDQVRFFKLEGDHLTITAPPAKNIIPGVEASTGVLVWEREH
ncbi:MAG TPA: lipocalin-like domain-containing protein [Xanthobacteraceae bacterium]|nr:lipocalin-like domain-containing protein [Xanthobacteraceae bacterium]